MGSTVPPNPNTLRNILDLNALPVGSSPLLNKSTASASASVGTDLSASSRFRSAWPSR